MTPKAISPFTLSAAAFVFGLGVALCAPAFADPREDRERLKPSERVAQIFERLDADEDDRISRSEAEESKLERRFERIDEDENGFVSRKELLKALKDRKSRQPPKQCE